MIESYESKCILIYRYQYVSLPLLPKVAQVPQILLSKITARKTLFVIQLKIRVFGNFTGFMVYSR